MCTKKAIPDPEHPAESIPYVMNDDLSDPFGGMKTKFREVTPERKLRSDPGFPHTSLREMSHTRPALLTVFSTTQLDHSRTHGIYMRIHWRYCHGRTVCGWKQRWALKDSVC
jgi:hypothetical protein